MTARGRVGAVVHREGLSDVRRWRGAWCLAALTVSLPPKGQVTQLVQGGHRVHRGPSRRASKTCRWVSTRCRCRFPFAPQGHFFALAPPVKRHTPIPDHTFRHSPGWRALAPARRGSRGRGRPSFNAPRPAPRVLATVASFPRRRPGRAKLSRAGLFVSRSPFHSASAMPSAMPSAATPHARPLRSARLPGTPRQAPRPPLHG